MKSFIFIFFAAFFLVVSGCKSDPKPTTTTEPTVEQSDAQTFLDAYNTEYQRLYYASAQAAWKTNTEIMEGDTVNAYNSRVADEALAAFTGSVDNISKTRELLADYAARTYDRSLTKEAACAATRKS